MVLRHSWGSKCPRKMEYNCQAALRDPLRLVVFRVKWAQSAWWYAALQPHSTALSGHEASKEFVSTRLGLGKGESDVRRWVGRFAKHWILRLNLIRARKGVRHEGGEESEIVVSLWVMGLIGVWNGVLKEKARMDGVGQRVRCLNLRICWVGDVGVM